MRHHNISAAMTYYANVDDAVAQAVKAREPSLRNILRNAEDISTAVQDEDNRISSDTNRV